MKKCSTCGNLYSGDLCPQCVAKFAQQSTGPGANQEEPPLKDGDLFHGLEIVQLLGRGGMGVVYKARQPALDRHVALKLLPKKMAQDPDFQSRFIREAKALGALSHPSIVAVHDFGAEGGHFFFVMEFVDGVNLRQVLRDKKLTPEQAIKIVPQLCDALEYAHEEGVVHRDIKPENILIDKKGRVKIADFGLAKLIGADSAVHLTMTNMVMGTPHYMAPEQVENPKSVDHRADIYSMGVVFYEMLTGELPIGRFEAPSKKVQIDVRLDDVVLKTLEKTPERRYQKASEVKDAVTRLTSVSSIESYKPTVMTPAPATRHRWPLTLGGLILAGVVIACATAVGVVYLKGKGKDDPVARLHSEAAGLFAAGEYDKALGLYEAMDRLAATDALRAQARKGLEECRAKIAAAGPVDLTRYFISEKDKAVPMGLVPPGGKLVRNPLYAKDAADAERVANWLGLQSLTPSDVKQAYLAVWFRAEAFYVVLNTPVAEQVEREFSEQKTWHNRWSYRKGDLVVLAVAQERWDRHLLVGLVAVARKKLGLPEEPLDAPLENLRYTKRELSSGLVLTRDSTTPDGFVQTLGKAEGERIVQVNAALLPTLLAAEQREVAWGKDPALAGALKVDVLRAGRTVAALSHWAKDAYFSERVSEQMRQWMGLPKRAWGTILPGAAELPDGYAFDKVEGDTAKVLRDLDLQGIPSAEVTHAWRATLKPAGSIVLLEIGDTQVRSKAEHLLNRPADYRDTAEDQDVWVYAVDAPDDPGLDALQNLMRGKFGYSPQPPRYVKLRHVRLRDGDLPAGYKILRAGTPSDEEDRGELDGPQGKLTFSMKDYSDLKYLWNDLRTQPKAPGETLLHKDFLLVRVRGPESAWGVMDQLEAAFRKKMRLGPPSAEEYGIAASELPQGLAYLDRKEIGYSPNPSSAEDPTPDMSSRWRAVIDPGETFVTIMVSHDAEKVRKLEQTIRQSLKGTPETVIFTKGTTVAVVQQFKGNQAPYQAVSEILRAKLRLPK